MPESAEQIAVKIKAMVKSRGFALCGISEADRSPHAEHVINWLNDGKHGEMGYLANHVALRIDPREMVAGARSVISVADRLPTGELEVGEHEDGGPEGKLAKYVHVSDYHKVMKKRLIQVADGLREAYPAYEFRACVDTAPVLEREFAAKAGLGWVGKNTMLIHPVFGSHLMLGEIITTMPVAVDEPEADHCGTCTRCIDACPTQCITEYEIDASACIAYLTIELRRMIPEKYHDAIGEHLFGCDVCQDVCPHNHKVPVGGLPAGYEYGVSRVSLFPMLDWGEGDRQELITRSALKRAKLEMLKRNALIVIGNVLKQDGMEKWGINDETKAKILMKLKCIKDDKEESEVVQTTAQHILAKFSGV